MQLDLANHLKELYDDFMECNCEEDRAQIHLDYKGKGCSKPTTGLVVEELNVLLTVSLSNAYTFIDLDDDLNCDKFIVDYLRIDSISHHTIIY
jgi:hypothetical protein